MKLKPCPFCGGVAVQRFSIWGESYAYGCCTTGCMGNVHNYTSGFKTDKEAIEAWNRREPIDKIVEQLGEKFLAEKNFRAKGCWLDAIEIVKSGGAM